MSLYEQTVLETRTVEVVYTVEAEDVAEALNKVAVGDVVGATEVPHSQKAVRQEPLNDVSESPITLQRFEVNGEMVEGRLLTDTEYVEHGGCCCPRCRSDSLDGASVDIEGRHAIQELLCNTCGYSWNDVYELVGYNPANE